MYPVQDGAAAPGQPESRNASFSLGRDSQRFNDMVPKTSMPMSVLQSPRPGLNAMSTGDYDRVMPGGMILPTANASSANTYQQSIMLRMSKGM